MDGVSSCSLHTCIITLTPSTEDLVRRMLPLGFSRSEIQQQLYLSSNNADIAACRLLDREGGEGGGEGEEEEKLVDDSKESTEKKKKFSIEKFEVHSYIHHM